MTRIKTVVSSLRNHPWGSIAAKDVPVYKIMMRVLLGFAEHAAGEAFKWVGWAAVLGTLEAVRRQTGTEWIIYLQIVLAVLIYLRMQWRLMIKFPETETPDGSIKLHIARWHTLASVLTTVVIFIILMTLTVGLANLIADVELLQFAQR